MYNSSTQGIIVFVIIATTLILAMAVFISFIIYRYQQKQNIYFKELETLKSTFENEILKSQIEIQELTFENISREIHDNIGQKLTLAKLHLNTLEFNDSNKAASQVNGTIEMISEAINDLSDISRSMSSEIILNNGLQKALEFETNQLLKSGLYKITLDVSGESVFWDSQKELVLFRIVQEALHNIIKHAAASAIAIRLYYADNFLQLDISDNGKGFQSGQKSDQGTGLLNMQKRADMLNGNCIINSHPGKGTEINIKIPIYEHEYTLYNNLS